MENYIDKLIYLIELKKEKKEPKNLEKSEFADAWGMLVKEEGFSERAEKFLYNGFVFCGARPFQEYMKDCSNQLNALNELYSGKLYGENCVSTTSILTHLLSLSLNDFSEDLAVVISLMQHIPSALKNKEGHIYGQADRVLKKYFFDVLRVDAELPELVLLLDSGMEQANLNDFIDAFDAIVEKADFSKYSRNCQNNLEKVKKWLHSGQKTIRSDSAFENASTQTGSDAAENAVQSDNESLENYDNLLQDKVELKHEMPETATDENLKMLQEPSELADLRKKLEVEKKRRIQSEKTAAEYKKRIREIEESLKTKEGELAIKDKRIKELSTENGTLRSRVVLLEERVKKLEEEVEQRSEMIEMLRRDRTKQSDENLRRLASKLRTYYLDYQDAKELEMSVELGENMRDQLGDVLKIISSAGTTGK